MRLGRLEIKAASDGFFRLDGGAMFGIVPQTLWKKQIAPDSLNRIILGLNILVIDNGREVVIVDTGIGSKSDSRFNSRYGVERERDVVEDLKRMGYNPEDIDKVILTHLHFDHSGGATCIDHHGGIKPTYPAATYFVQTAEWEDATSPNEITRASYLPENFMPLEKSGQIEMLKGDSAITDEVRVELTGGHTRGHQVIFIESEGENVVHLGDLVPTSYHLPLPYIMGYDTMPLSTLETRRKLYGKAVDLGWRLFFGHDMNPKLAGLVEKDRSFAVDESKVVRFKKARRPGLR